MASDTHGDKGGWIAGNDLEPEPRTDEYLLPAERLDRAYSEPIFVEVITEEPVEYMAPARPDHNQGGEPVDESAEQTPSGSDTDIDHEPQRPGTQSLNPDENRSPTTNNAGREPEDALAETQPEDT